MPEFLEKKLRKEYGNNPAAIYGTMNKLGAMHGNKETAKGKQMEKKHEAKMHNFSRTSITHHPDGSHTVEHMPKMKAAGKSGAFMEHAEPTSYTAANNEELMAKMGQHMGVSDGEGAEEELAD